VSAPGSSVDVTSSYRFIHLSQSSFARGATMLVASTVSIPFPCANARAPEETKVLGHATSPSAVHLK